MKALLAGIVMILATAIGIGVPAMSQAAVAHQPQVWRTVAGNGVPEQAGSTAIQAVKAAIHAADALHPKTRSTPVRPLDVALPAYPPHSCNRDNAGEVWVDPDDVYWYCVCFEIVREDGTIVGPFCDWALNEPKESQFSYLAMAQANEAVLSDKAFFVAQTDGNLVVYDEYYRARWSARTNGRGTAATIFQQDGNLVQYDWSSRPVWASGTCCRSDAYLTGQNDGNVVIYATNGPIWATGTNH